jgi:hypothetical protein
VTNLLIIYNDEKKSVSHWAYWHLQTESTFVSLVSHHTEECMRCYTSGLSWAAALASLSLAVGTMAIKFIPVLANLVAGRI